MAKNRSNTEMKLIEPKREELLTAWITLYKLRHNDKCNKVEAEAVDMLLRLLDKEQNRMLNHE